jgi:hypothetical protein
MDIGRSRGRWPLVALFFLLAIAGCSYPYFFWLAPGATAESLIFHHSFKPRGDRFAALDYVQVGSCEVILPDARRIEGVRKWRYDRNHGTMPTEADHAIRYGKAPLGAVDRTPAVPLGPGCYRLDGSTPGASGHLYFWVLDDGSARDFTEAERDSLHAVGERHARIQEAAHQRAKEACRQRYLAAGPDTAAWAPIDPLVLSDTLRYSRISCKRFREMYPALIPATPPTALLGTFEDDYQNRFTISATEWLQLPHGKFNVVRWNAESRYLIAQNDAANSHAPGKWTRIDWVMLDGMAPWEWAFCLTAYEAPTADSAEATRTARPETPRTGCNGYPYSRMKRMVG